MKIVQFKDGSYAIRGINLWHFLESEWSIFQYVRLHNIRNETNLETELQLKQTSLRTKEEIELFESRLWQTIYIKESYYVDNSCKIGDYGLILKYYNFLTKKQYKNNLTKFDYGKAI